MQTPDPEPHPGPLTCLTSKWCQAASEAVGMRGRLRNDTLKAPSDPPAPLHAGFTYRAPGTRGRPGHSGVLVVLGSPRVAPGCPRSGMTHFSQQHNHGCGLWVTAPTGAQNNLWGGAPSCSWLWGSSGGLEG